MKLALTQTEAAETLSVSRPFFAEHVLPYIKVVRRGRRTIIPVAELDAWLTREAQAL